MKFLLWKCSIHAGDTFIRRLSALCFGMRVGAVTCGIWFKIIWCLGMFGLQELGGSLKDISKTCFSAHNLHGRCVLSIGPGHVKETFFQSFPGQPNKYSQPATNGHVHKHLLPCWQSICKQIRNCLGRGHDGKSLSGSLFTSCTFSWVWKSNDQLAALLRSVTWPWSPA